MGALQWLNIILQRDVHFQELPPDNKIVDRIRFPGRVLLIFVSNDSNIFHLMFETLMQPDRSGGKLIHRIGCRPIH